MISDNQKPIVTLVIGVLCFAAAIYHIKKEPRRILNGILLFTSLTFTFRAALLLIFPDRELPAHELALGAGSEFLFSLFLISLPASFIAGILLIWNGIKVMNKEGRSTAHALPVIWGICAMLWPVIVGLASLFVVLQSSPWVVFIAQIMYELILFVPRMLFVFLLYSIVYAFLPKDKKCDFILVLGAKVRKDGTVTPLLAGRLDRGIRIFEAGGKKAVFIASGGKGDDETVSEAYAMKQYLLEKDISDKLIIMEDQSVNTYQNMKFSKAIMEAAKPDYKCLFVTNNYHVLRAAILARAVGLNAQGTGSHTAFYYLPAAFIREHIAIIFKYNRLVLGYLGMILVYQVLQAVTQI